MQSGETLLRRLLDAILPNRAAPVLARVLQAHEGPGKTKYSVDVRVVTAGTLEDTDQVISEVPISPIWATQKKRGVYAIPNEGQVVIVSFINWNPAYPYLAGIWSDEYEADEFGKDKFVITDGAGMKFVIDAKEKGIEITNGEGCVIKLEKGNKASLDNGRFQVILNGDKCAVKNGSKSLFTVLDNIVKHVSGMKTVGSPAQHVVSPDDITKFTTDGQDVAALLEA
ncbi:hypothetical protein FACS1894147_02540 [Spirochaetia bacterium]|nr:hypothetical protein FACS1894147_02540 [Spirochaetia bacterium]